MGACHVFLAALLFVEAQPVDTEDIGMGLD